MSWLYAFKDLPCCRLTAMFFEDRIDLWWVKKLEKAQSNAALGEPLPWMLAITRTRKPNLKYIYRFRAFVYLLLSAVKIIALINQRVSRSSNSPKQQVAPLHNLWHNLKFAQNFPFLKKCTHSKLRLPLLLLLLPFRRQKVKPVGARRGPVSRCHLVPREPWLSNLARANDYLWCRRTFRTPSHFSGLPFFGAFFMCSCRGHPSAVQFCAARSRY